MSVIEAMALGIPVIGGARSGGVPWTLAEGRAGLLVDVSSPEAVAGAMERLASDVAAREDWGSRARSHVERRFHIRAVADAYESVYSELLSRG